MIALGYIDLGTYYQLNFSLMQHHKYSLSDINDMYPFERDIYVSMLRDHLEHVKKQQEMAKT